MFRTRQRLQGRIERLMDHARVTTDDELQAELARYLCILVSSLIEERCRERASTFRNQLAHGVNVGLSLGMLTAYANRAREAMGKLDRQFG